MTTIIVTLAAVLFMVKIIGNAFLQFSVIAMMLLFIRGGEGLTPRQEIQSAYSKPHRWNALFFNKNT